MTFQVVPATAWKKRVKRLSREESARTERLARVLALAEFALDDQEKARAWIETHQLELAGKTPIETARTEIGARRVEDILNVLIFGLPA